MISMFKSEKTIIYVVPAVVWAILIFIGSSIPGSSIPQRVLNIRDLILHFIEFAGFGFLLALAIAKSPDCVTARNFFLAALIGIVYGASDEIHQMFVRGRVAAVEDFLADAAGVLFGLALFVTVPRLLSLFRPSEA